MSSEEETKRVFVGIKVPESVAIHLRGVQKRFEDLPVRYVNADDMHITLVPPWQESDIPQALGRIEKIVRHAKSFELRLEALKPGPDKRHARLFWVGCRVTSELSDLQQELIDDFDVESSREFTPHITIVRFKKEDNNRFKKVDLQLPGNLQFDVNSVQLIESPKQPATGYTVLESIQFSHV